MRRLLPLLLAALCAALLFAAFAQARPRTTVEQTILDRDGDNRLEPAPRDEYSVRDDLGSPPSPERERTRQRILFFGQMSDTHVVDEESPLRVEFLDKFRGPFTSAYRPQEGLSPQVLQEMAEQMRNTTSPVRPSIPIQLVMTTGDNTDNTQCNETRWMIDILDGKIVVNPDSGLLAGESVTGSGCAVGLPAPAVSVPPTCTARATPDDRYDGPRGGREYYEPDSSDGEDGFGYSPRLGENGRSSQVRDFPNLFQEMNEPFKPTGLRELPWYAVFGNHDGLVQGNQPRNLALEAYAIGCAKITDLPTASVEAMRVALLGGDSEAFQEAFVGALGSATTQIVPPDPRRRPLRKHEWIEEHFATTGTPIGHGFQHRPLSAVDGMGYYAFSPAQQAPPDEPRETPRLKFIALDTVAETGLEEGNIDESQFRWLDAELTEADEAQQYVMVFAHHSLETMGQPPVSPFPTTFDQGGDPSPLVHYGNSIRGAPTVPCTDESNTPGSTTETVRCLFLRHPSVVAFVNGHEHNNRIDPVERRDATGRVVGGFWEVNTASHIDWPQQSRVIDLFDNRDGTLSIFGTILDHAAAPDPGGPPAPREGQGTSGDAVKRLASISRELSFNDIDANHDDGDGSGGGRGGEDDRNVELLVRDPFAE